MKNSKVRIREGSAEDIPEIARVHVQSWRETYRGQVPDACLNDLTVESRIKMWERVFGSGTQVLVAEDETAIVGISSFGDTDLKDAGEIYTMYVLKAHWGAGVGGALMNGVLNALRSSRVRVVKLWVLTTNARAIAFYKKHGFVEEGQPKMVERFGFDLVESRYGLYFE